MPLKDVNTVNFGGFLPVTPVQKVQSSLNYDKALQDAGLKFANNSLLNNPQASICQLA